MPSQHDTWSAHIQLSIAPQGANGRLKDWLKAIIVTTNCNINLPKMNTAGTKLFWLSFLSAVSSISKGLVHCGMTVSSGWDVGRTLSLSMIGSTHSYSCSSNGMTSPAVVSCTSGPNTRTGDSGCRPRLTVAFIARALGSLCDDVGLCRWPIMLLWKCTQQVHAYLWKSVNFIQKRSLSCVEFSLDISEQSGIAIPSSFARLRPLCWALYHGKKHCLQKKINKISSADVSWACTYTGCLRLTYDIPFPCGGSNCMRHFHHEPAVVIQFLGWQDLLNKPEIKICLWPILFSP